MKGPPTACVLLILTSILLTCGLQAAGTSTHILWFEAPAAHFTESCPLGNGRLGAMLFGGVNEERLVLNESGMWSGSPQDADRPDAALALPEIRRLLLEGRNSEAEKLVNTNFTCAGAGSGRGRGAKSPYGAYQVLGNLRLNFIHPSSKKPDERNYRRELDLSEAVARVTYETGGIRYIREAFVSAPDEAIVLHLTANKPGAIGFDAVLDRPEQFETVASGSAGLRMSGQLDNGVDGKGVQFEAHLRVLNHGGSVKAVGNTLQARGVDEVLLLLTAATNIRTFAGRKVDDAAKTAAADLARAAAKSYEALRRGHVADYQRYFNRMSMRLGPAIAEATTKSTPSRLRTLSQGAVDPGLMALYFDFGRYLLISSSRPGGLPANLQGIWAEEVQTPWNADWHLNINVQMNYWQAEVCNLSELHKPLFALIASLQEPGSRTANKYYGARGWVSHVITNPWGFTSPGESATWGSSTTGSAWLCQHLWDHYLFTGDRAFLEWAYPIMKSSAQFYIDMLVEEPKNHWLVTAPSNSPENTFLSPGGAKTHICLGATMDMQVLRYLFDACVEAARILGLDQDLRAKLAEERARLAPTRVGSDGRIMEWMEEYPEDDPHHRHISHLWGLYPGTELTPQSTPDLAMAARKTLEARGDGGTGWCLAYKLIHWARLGDGERAFKLLSEQLQPASVTDRIAVTGGGTYPNLFDAHPPFQIDGNFGATAGIAEMLMQSQVRSGSSGQASEIVLFPALPANWAEGEVRGLRARGGFEVDLRWQGSKLSQAIIRSVGGRKAKIRLGEKVADLRLAPNGTRRLGPDLR